MSVLDRFTAHPLRASPSQWPLLLPNPQLICLLLVPRLKLMRQQKMPVSKRIEASWIIIALHPVSQKCMITLNWWSHFTTLAQPYTAWPNVIPNSTHVHS